ncbi:HD domain-containing protein [Lentzea waywayandensis]|uniref:HD domain-containing protein n=1 Tax=Lentzea waywayandensis TaxID=84724 RepID=A0A1I6F5M0_9PSEU|nr:HD domain-containing protein [Lentzea waywayandensis]SFR25329.1 HD domain-containing protein [Lentzea waywayandensis]
MSLEPLRHTGPAADRRAEAETADRRGEAETAGVASTVPAPMSAKAEPLARRAMTEEVALRPLPPAAEPPARRAMTEDVALRPLPPAAETLLSDLQASPRLVAHLRAVHDVACQLISWVERRHPAVAVDRDAVLFGAATHDIGKVLRPNELSGPGSAHEPAGYELLRARGVEERLARFARTHGSWTAEGIGLEDLLVSLADKVWKAKRVPDLEQLVTGRLAEVENLEAWEVFMALDDELDRIASGADARLAFQASYPVAG